MLDRQLLRNQPEKVIEGATKKNTEAPVQEWIDLDIKYREVLTELEQLRSQSNNISKEIGLLMQKGEREQAEKIKIQTKEIKQKIEQLESSVDQFESDLKYIELRIPNPPQESVPVGKDENDNRFVRDWGTKPQLSTTPQPHWEIAERLGLLDFQRASKISGSGYAVYTGKGARLQRALIQFMIDHQTLTNGYQEVYPPVLVNDYCLVGTGSLPKFEEDLYKTNDQQYLIPTAEVPLTNLYRDEILSAEDLPMKMAAFSGCFRREAGAAGKDTRGLLRMHQFDKVELVKYTLPEKSNEELELLVTDAESILQTLGLHYRVMEMCTGELSFQNCKQYDLELWAPGVEKYLEISSCSTFGDFQARRANIRFRRAAGEKPEFVHTLNGSGLATPRLFAAILETHLQPDGSVTIPKPLVPYTGFEIITK
jgi:seryl-tRNA synthetase